MHYRTLHPRTCHELASVPFSSVCCRAGDAFTRGVSGGERKRVAFGQALLGNPAVIFLDEPTSGWEAHALAESLGPDVSITVMVSRSPLCRDAIAGLDAFQSQNVMEVSAWWLLRACQRAAALGAETLFRGRRCLRLISH